MRLGTVHVGGVTDESADRHLAILDRDLDAARIELGIVDQTFGEFTADIRVGTPEASGVADFGKSAMSMLTFVLNRGGKGLSASRRKTLEAAKGELRRLFGKQKA
jgi:uncharacterized protein DUF3175